MLVGGAARYKGGTAQEAHKVARAGRAQCGLVNVFQGQFAVENKNEVTSDGRTTS